MTQDIMRRILRDYFGYELHFVTNITDVDDKVTFLAPSRLEGMKLKEKKMRRVHLDRSFFEHDNLTCSTSILRLSVHHLTLSLLPSRRTSRKLGRHISSSR